MGCTGRRGHAERSWPIALLALPALCGFLAPDDSLAQDLGGALQKLIAPTPAQPAPAAKPVAEQPAGPAAGLVRSASPELSLKAFQQVYPGQVIPLGVGGEIVISYFSSCMVETATGGNLKIGTLGGSDPAGKISSVRNACVPKPVVTASSNAEAGAVAERLSPFQPALWKETTVSSTEPRFEFKGQRGLGHALVTMLDAPAPTPIWQGDVRDGVLIYSAKLPKLQPGRPYRIEVAAGPRHWSATFSIDPGLKDPNGSSITSILLTE